MTEQLPSDLSYLKSLQRPTRTAGEGYAVPQARAERLRLEAAARQFAEAAGFVPPLSWQELRAHSHQLARAAGADERYGYFLTVLLNNAVWRDVVSAVPFKRRTLLLPPCMRSAEKCPAEFDELGLLCRQCGCCDIGPLQAEAEQLGYAVLIAEGTSIVNALIDRGIVDAVIGVSCMASLERAFPYMTANAVPGIAVPLLVDGCSGTRVDIEWLRREMRSSGSVCPPHAINLERLRSQVESWFDISHLRRELDAPASDTQATSLAYLAKAGKRWRPLLTACVYEALAAQAGDQMPPEVRKVALAVECFHKASLIHDDIEDGDAWRYGEQTLHRARGVPAALNAGDFLIFEGYKLIGECGAAPRAVAEMLSVAAEAHRSLCIGQGIELCRAGGPERLSQREVLEIFRLKTAPAFEVALRLGAILAGADHQTHRILKRYSEALGAAYQIQDDIEDFASAHDGWAGGPSILPAVAWQIAERKGDETVRSLRRAWEKSGRGPGELRRLIRRLGAEQRARELLELHKAKAVRSLRPLASANLKMLLYRLAGRIIKTTA